MGLRRELEKVAELLKELAKDPAVDADAVREALKQAEELVTAIEGKDPLELEVGSWPGSHSSDFAVTDGLVLVETVSYEDYGEGFVERKKLVPVSERVEVQYYATFEPEPGAFGTWREVRTWYVYERGKGWRIEKTEERTGWDELDRARASEEEALEERA
jgi:hypothetical protein